MLGISQGEIKKKVLRDAGVYEESRWTDIKTMRSQIVLNEANILNLVVDP